MRGISLVLLALICMAFTWPSKEKNPAKPTSSSSASREKQAASGTQAGVSEPSKRPVPPASEAVSSRRPEGETRPSASKIPDLPAGTGKASPGPVIVPPRVPNIPLPPKIPAVPPKIPAVPPVAEVQKQLDEIMRINQVLRTNYASQAAEVQRMAEQARLHQEILKTIQNREKIPPAGSEAAVPAAASSKPNTRVKSPSAAAPIPARSRSSTKEPEPDEESAPPAQ